VDPLVGGVGQAAQTFAQFIVPGGQLLQALLLQPFGQTFPQPLQFLESFVLLISHPLPASLSQSANPVVHDETPQTEPAHVSTALLVLHVLSQPPQCAGSTVVFTQAALAPVPQRVGNCALSQETPQDVPLHVAAPPAGAAQAVHEVPHELVDVLLEQVVPQRCVPAGHAHIDDWQIIPPLHWVPHEPQLVGSVFMSTHCALAPLPQSVCPVGQTHAPP
jgi:hypothetical protein